MTNHCELFNFVTCCVVIGTLCVFGLVGNATAIWVFKMHPTVTSTISILLVLAVGDSLLLATTLLLYTARSIYPYTQLAHGLHTFSGLIEPYIWPFATITHTCTVYLTVMVTATRYVSVCKVGKSSRGKLIHDFRFQVALVIVCSVIYNIPRFFEHHPVMVPIDDANFRQYTVAHNNASINGTEVMIEGDVTPMNLGDVRLYQIIYSNIIYFIVMFIVPLTSLTYMNVRLIQTISEMKRKRESMTGHKARDDHITLCIIAIVCVFVVCQTPALVNQIFWAINSPACGSFHYYYTKISDTLVVLNSSCNFMIYCLFGQSFRRIFLQTVCGKRYDSDRRTAAHDRATLPLIEVCAACRSDAQAADDVTSKHTAATSAGAPPPPPAIKTCTCKRGLSNGTSVKPSEATCITATVSHSRLADSLREPPPQGAAEENGNFLNVVHHSYSKPNTA